jgi:hypothetical protein
MTKYANGWIYLWNSLDQVKSNIDRIRNERYKAEILMKDVYRNQRQLLTGSIDQTGKDLQDIKK